MSNIDYPETIHWAGLRLHKVPHARDELVRYECNIDIRVQLWKHYSQQWQALFEIGVYSIASSYEEALQEAAINAANMLRFKAATLDSLVFRGLYDQ
jgi:hypothetical protein